VGQDRFGGAAIRAFWVNSRIVAAARITLSQYSPVGTIGNTSSDRRIFLYSFLFVLLAITVPILLVEVPPLGDYPNHLGRIFILNDILRDPVPNKYFELSLHPVPNLAFDLFMLPVSQIISPYIAGRLFLALSLVITVAGVCLLHHALFGVRSFWPLVSAILAYNGIFLAGLVNYSLGVGLALVFGAVWIRISSWPRAPRILYGLLLATILYFVHVLAVGLYALLVAVLELWRLVANRHRRPLQLLVDLIIAGLPFLVPMTLFWMTTDFVHEIGHASASEGDSQPVSASMIGIAQLIIDRAMERTKLFIRMIGSGYYVWLNLAIVVLACAILVYAIVSRSLRIRWQPIIAAVILLTLFFVISDGNVFHVNNVHLRFPIMIVLLCIAGSDVRPSQRAIPILVGCLGAFFMVQTLVVAANFRAYNQELTEFRLAFSHIEPGAKVFSTKPDGLPAEIFRVEPVQQVFLTRLSSLYNLQVLMVAERRAFSPNFFAHPQKQILKVRDAYKELAYNDGGFPTPWSWAMDVLHFPNAPHPFLNDQMWEPTRDWWQRYDYLTVIYPSFIVGLPEDNDRLLKLVFTGRWIRIYRIQHSANRVRQLLD